METIKIEFEGKEIELKYEKSNPSCKGCFFENVLDCLMKTGIDCCPARDEWYILKEVNHD